MIGRRSALIAALAVIGTALVCNVGGPGPEAALGADRLVADRAAAADDALAALGDGLQPAVDAARAGASRVVAGAEPPGPPLLDAADHVAAAADAVVAARAACVDLLAALRARDVDASPLPPCPDPGELSSIAGQLESTAAAGEAFAAVRHRAEHVTVALEAALRALDAGDADAAAMALAEARADHDAVAALEPMPVTLPVWIGTTDAMIGAVERVIDATRAGDMAAAEAAAADFAALAHEAVTADRALRIAIAEGGIAVTSPALERLAAALGRLEDLRAAVLALGGQPA